MQEKTWRSPPHARWHYSPTIRQCFPFYFSKTKCSQLDKITVVTCKGNNTTVHPILLHCQTLTCQDESALSKSFKKVSDCVCVRACAHTHAHAGTAEITEIYQASAMKDAGFPLTLSLWAEATEYFLGQEGSRWLFRQIRVTWSGWASKLNWKHLLKF